MGHEGIVSNINILYYKDRDKKGYHLHFHLDITLAH